MTMMVFDENYGELPKRVLKAIRRFNVSPADYLMMEIQGITGEDAVSHIYNNSDGGMYRPPMGY